MRYLMCFWIALCFPAVTICATYRPRFSSTEQEVLNVSQARLDAYNTRNTAAMSHIVADECVISSDDGVLVTKAQYLEHMAKMPADYDYSTNPREFVVRLRDSTAVLNFRVTVHEQFGAINLISEQRRTETWFRQNGSWQLIAVQWDNLPVNFRQPVSINANILKDYVGKYVSRPSDDLEVIFAKDGKLWSQILNDVAEYLPAGGDAFFLKEGSLATIMFLRDRRGHVAGYAYHRADGQEFRVKKIG